MGPDPRLRSRDPFFNKKYKVYSTNSQVITELMVFVYVGSEGLSQAACEMLLESLRSPKHGSTRRSAMHSFRCKSGTEKDVVAAVNM